MAVVALKGFSGPGQTGAANVFSEMLSGSHLYLNLDTHTASVNDDFLILFFHQERLGSEMKNDLRLDTKLLGSVLRRTRELARIPFRQLASDSGVSTSQIMRIESGEFDCHVSSLISLCGALGIRFGELLQRCVLADSWIYREALNREIKSN